MFVNFLQGRIVVEEVFLGSRMPHLRLRVPASQVRRKRLDSINALQAVPVTHAPPHSSDNGGGGGATAAAVAAAATKKAN